MNFQDFGNPHRWCPGGSLARDRPRAPHRRLGQCPRRGAAHGAALGGAAGRLRGGDEPGEQDAWSATGMGGR